MYYKRIADLRIDNDLSQREVAKRLGLNREVYRRYENGEREIPSACLINIAYLYNVSLEYIVGLSNTRQPVMPYPDIFYDSFNNKVAEKATEDTE